MDESELLHQEARRVHVVWDPEQVRRRAAQRSRRRRISAGIVGLGGFAAVVAVLIALSTGPDAVPPAQAPELTPMQPGTCEYGPWLKECPEADWARAVLVEADVTINEETASAFVVAHPEGEVLFWAMDPVNHPGMKTLEQAVNSSDLTLEARIDGVPVYRGDVDWAWSVHGLNVWVTEHSGESPSLNLLAQLVSASRSVPYPPPATSLSP